MSAPLPLDPLDFPLHGSRLIEASAGTGKTYTLALLYVRLVLGHGGQGQAFARPLTPAEILVVTFTEAAAGELRERIRARLVEAADCFQMDPDTRLDDPADIALRRLRASYPAKDWPGCAWRLQMAAEAMDEACISTIHGWCNRMLREHAFDTRGLFQRELLSDTKDLLTQAVRDYWRIHFYPLSEQQAQCVSQAFSQPDSLQAALIGLLGADTQGVSFKGEPLRVDDLGPFIQLQLDYEHRHQAAQAEQEASQQALQAQQAEVRTLWRQDWTEIRNQLLQLRPHLNGTRHDSSTEEKFNALLDAIQAWTQGGPEPAKLANFARGQFRFKAKAALQQAPDLAAFDRLGDLLQARAQSETAIDALQPPQPGLQAAILAHALDWVGQRLAENLKRQAAMGFDDLLLQLQQALDPQYAGDHAEHLAEVLTEAFPVALIDEFQDTDPIQYRIFERIYGLSDAEQAANPQAPARPITGLFLIGDPKQAIYSFRGADIHSYLEARQATAGRHYSLSRNFRSSQGLVTACNFLFGQAEAFPGGAFRFAQGGHNPLPYVQVEAQGVDEQLYLPGQQGQAQRPLTLWYLPPAAGAEALGMEDYRAQAARLAARRVAQWLAAAGQGQAGFGPLAQGVREGQANPITRPLQAADIAILVRQGSEALLLRRELDSLGVASVYLSDRESVFCSAEAVDLVHWLSACNEPGNEALVRKALASNSLALPIEQLAAWQEDELAWEAQMQRFARLQQIWRGQGVLAMLYCLLDEYELPARLKGSGERSLTNLLHLAEWLQQAQAQLDGEQALIRHLSEHLGLKDEQQLLRLESDEARVKLVTIHKSKGLEYPLVLLPFIAAWREIDGKTRQVPWRHQGASYREVAGKQAFGQAWEQANTERLSEDMRLLYVALTRARHALWLGLAPLKSGNAKYPQLERSALGHLLNGGTRISGPEQLLGRLRAWLAACDQIALEAVDGEQGLDLNLNPDSPDSTPQDDTQPAPPLGQARPAPELGDIADWWIASYSAIGYQDGNDRPAPAPAQAQSPYLRDQEPDSARSAKAEELRGQTEAELEPTKLEAQATTSGGPPGKAQVMQQLPAGSLWGTFLHGLLEWAAEQRYRSTDGRLLRGFAAAVADDAGRRDQLARRCRLRAIGHLAGPLSDWLKGFLQQPWTLPGSGIQGFSLVDLNPAEMAVELEFLIGCQGLDIAELDRQIIDLSLDGAPRPCAQPTRLKGLLKGFIDLVVVHQGRYYVIDWKSNHLGQGPQAYSQSAMRQAILGHRYDLQYLLYLLALHRLLQARLPDYDYDRHVGGAIYVFLRARPGPDPAQGLFFDRPSRRLIERMDRAFRQGNPGLESTKGNP
ncbi:MAG: exodeoxyribonuclease V subunit beta [Gammaproteobacteria bacterium SHHR-1]